MSGTAKEAERAQEQRRRAEKGDQAAKDELSRGENTPYPAPAMPHDPSLVKPARPE